MVARILLATSIALAFASTFFLTLELDEAWIFGPTSQRVAGTWEVPGLNPALTSGGLHFVLQAIASAFGLHEYHFFRIVSVGYFLFLAYVLSRTFDLSKQVRNGTLILLAAVLSVPGLLLHCALAFSTVLAIGLFFTTLLVWLHYPVGSAQRRIFAGFLLGTTIATRFNMLPAIPVLVAFGFFTGSSRRAELKDASLIVAIALATLGGSHLLQILVSDSSRSLEDLFWLTLKVAGVWDKSDVSGNPQAAGGGLASYFHLWVWLDRWQLATQRFPLWIMLLASAYAWAPLEKLRSTRDTTILRFLATFGWVSWFAWLLLSPLPWYRYLLPSLIGFAAIFGHLLIQLYLVMIEHKRDVAFIIPIIAVASLLNATVIGIRHLRLGDSGRIVREYSGVAILANNPYDAFAAEDVQIELASFVREKTDDGRSIAVAGQEYDQLPLAFRSGRSLARLDESLEAHRHPEWIIVPPVGVSRDSRQVLDAQYRFVRWVGPYSIYQRLYHLTSGP